jgi:dimeric dUTPase (all-alpha-NTP-PPase superfamily)
MTDTHQEPEAEFDEDMLCMLFRMQKQLNDYAFSKQGITLNDGSIATMDKLIGIAVSGRDHTANSELNEWVSKYLMGLESEIRECKDELKWKWWSNGKIDVEKLRGEIVDAFHFLVSAAMASGMGPGDLMHRYRAKNAENIRRQDTGYVARNERPEV